VLLLVDLLCSLLPGSTVVVVESGVVEFCRTPTTPMTTDKRRAMPMEFNKQDVQLTSTTTLLVSTTS